VWAVLGPTGSGKSAVALALAEQLGAEILSVDSMQVYRGMNIGTAKASAEDQRRVRHHLIDLVEPSESFSAAAFQTEGRRVLADLETRGTPALLVGGSGLHFRSLVDPMEFPPADAAFREELDALDPLEARRRLLDADPEAAGVVDLANPRRVVRALEVLTLAGLTPSQRYISAAAEALRQYRSLVPVRPVGLDAGPQLAGLAERRVDEMLEQGLLTEVEHLADRLGRTASQAVGYKELLEVVRGEASLADGRVETIAATLTLAKRQRTFFRRDPRIRWLPWSADPNERVAVARRYLEEAAAWTS
jgi:tRNA dimethylallyltransferase